MKACGVAFQRHLGGHSMKSLREVEPDLSFPSLKGGLPHFIPRRLRSGQIPVSWVRLIMTMINLYRIIKAPMKLKIGTITSPFTGNSEKTLEIGEQLKTLVVPKLFAYSDFSFEDLEPGSWIKSLRSGPNGSQTWRQIITDGIAWYVSGSHSLVTWLSFIDSSYLGRFTRLMENCQFLDDHGALSPKARNSSALGKLSFKEEAAGKLRVFAMVDCWTQFVLQPLHKELFQVLKRLPNDGTFDQEASVNRSSEKIKRKGQAFSFDLSAATDRLPISIQSSILDGCWPGLGPKWVDLIANRDFVLPARPDYGLSEETRIRYAVGQPMGALSSWAMLALTHHCIVQLSFLRAYSDIHPANYAKLASKRYWFSDYEVLGDDIVIFDKLVADQYLIIMSDLGVEINLSKSIISPRGLALEFAKRTVIKTDSQFLDVSPLPWKLMLTGRDQLSRICILFTLLKRGWEINLNRSISAAFANPMKSQLLWSDPKRILEQSKRPLLALLRGITPSVGLLVLIDYLSSRVLKQFPVKTLWDWVKAPDEVSFEQLGRQTFAKVGYVAGLLDLAGVTESLSRLLPLPAESTNPLDILRLTGLDQIYAWLDSNNLVSPHDWSEFYLDRECYHSPSKQNVLVGDGPGFGIIPMELTSYQDHSPYSRSVSLDLDELFDLESLRSFDLQTAQFLQFAIEIEDADYALYDSIRQMRRSSAEDSKLYRLAIKALSQNPRVLRWRPLSDWLSKSYSDRPI